MFHAESLTLTTKGRGTYEITRQIQEIVGKAGIDRGLCTVFVHHTSASLILCENADPTVRHDLERYFGRLVPDGDPVFIHVDEGPDDMPAHVKASLMGSSLTVPVQQGRLCLGTWQGLYLCEHRNHGGRRRLMLTLHGE